MTIIVLVEDNPADVGLIRLALDKHSFEGDLIVFSDGERAVSYIDELASADCPSLAVIDLNLPRKPGSEVLRAFRASPVCGHIPIAILSSSDTQKDRDDAARLGASLYIRKPYQLDDFIAIGKVLKEMAESPFPR